MPQFLYESTPVLVFKDWSTLVKGLQSSLRRTESIIN